MLILQKLHHPTALSVGVVRRRCCLDRECPLLRLERLRHALDAPRQFLRMCIQPAQIAELTVSVRSLPLLPPPQ